MSKSIEALKRIETIFPFNRENKTNYYSSFLKSEIPFYEDFELVLKDLEVLEILKRLLHTSLYDDTDEAITFIFGTIYNAEEDEKIKEWLEQ